MSSGDYNNFSGRSNRPFTGQLPDLVQDPTSQILNKLPVIPGKRSLAEFQLQNYLRNVKPRRNTTNSLLGYPVSRNTEIPPGFLNYSTLVQNQMLNGFPENTQITPDFFNNTNLIPNQLTISRQITQNTPSFLNNPNLVPNQNILQEAEYPISRQNTQTTPDIFNNSNLVLNQNTQSTPNFLSYSNLVPTQNQKMMNRLQEIAFPLQKNSQNSPSLSSYLNLVPNHNNQNTIMNKLQELAKYSQITQNTPTLVNSSNLVPNHNQNTVMNKLQELAKTSQITQNTPKLLNSSDVVPNPSSKMMNKLQELEKHLLDDDDDGDEDTSSVVTNAEYSDTWRHLIGPRHHQHVAPSLSPTSSCSSCCSSNSPSSTLPLKQTLLEAATAITENKKELAREILTRLSQGACVTGTVEQRLVKYFSDALMARVGLTRGDDVACEAHAPETLFEFLPCFKLGFVAANLAILDATSVLDHATSAEKKIHIIDFEIGRGGHYVHLIHALAVKNKDIKNKEISLKITAVVKNELEISLERIGDGLRSLATKVGVRVNFVSLSLKVMDLSLERLGIEGDEDVAVNLPFILSKLPDESVTTENLRDELLRRVKSLSPTVVTVLEQEMNTNTAPFLARVNETFDYYSALFESLDSIVPRDDLERVKVEEGLGRKLANVVACEGVNRVERCEVFGKWRARMGMAGFKPKPIARPIVESLMGRVGLGTPGYPGFTVKEENGGVLFGWMGRTLTVASAWH